jgi:hypothetical protein
MKNFNNNQNIIKNQINAKSPIAIANFIAAKNEQEQYYMLS